MIWLYGFKLLSFIGSPREVCFFYRSTDGLYPTRKPSFVCQPREVIKEWTSPTILRAREVCLGWMGMLSFHSRSCLLQQQQVVYSRLKQPRRKVLCFEVLKEIVEDLHVSIDHISISMMIADPLTKRRASHPLLDALGAYLCKQCSLCPLVLLQITPGSEQSSLNSNPDFVRAFLGLYFIDIPISKKPDVMTKPLLPKVSLS